MRPNVPLAEVLLLAFGMRLETDQTLSLAQAIELVLKSGIKERAAVIEQLLNKFGFQGNGLAS